MLPDAAYAAALASLRGMGPVGLRRLLESTTARAAWESARSGEEWGEQARGIDVALLWAAHREPGIEVLSLGDPRYPAALAGDAEAPAVLFALGDPGVVDRHPRVAVVGTRSATRYGLGVAAQLGSDLTSAGVSVVSGLALGIDGAAHEGAVAAASTGAPPVGVVAGGLDAPYPRDHRRLWQRVAASGVLLSESPVGAPVPRWRFPLRNRILAALADIVVVVECHSRGGSLHTVRAAVRRGISVGAVPGSVRSPASAGTNDLLADGCFVVRDAADVLVAVGLARAGDVPVTAVRREPPAGATAEDPGARAEDAAGATAEDAAVLDALEWQACAVEEVLRCTGLPLPTVAVSLDRLRRAGLVHGDGGWWQKAP